MKTYETDDLMEMYTSLISSLEKREFAACKFKMGTIEMIFTTDDIPDNYLELEAEAAIEEMKIKAAVRKSKLLGIEGITKNLEEAYRKDGEEHLMKP